MIGSSSLGVSWMNMPLWISFFSSFSSESVQYLWIAGGSFLYSFHVFEAGRNRLGSISMSFLRGYFGVGEVGGMCSVSVFDWFVCAAFHDCSK